jgi:hypothetical protein
MLVLRSALGIIDGGTLVERTQFDKDEETPPDEVVGELNPFAPHRTCRHSDGAGVVPGTVRKRHRPATGNQVAPRSSPVAAWSD